MNFFKCSANDWADITDLSSSGSEFHKQLPDCQISQLPLNTSPDTCNMQVHNNYRSERGKFKCPLDINGVSLESSPSKQSTALVSTNSHQRTEQALVKVNYDSGHDISVDRKSI